MNNKKKKSNAYLPVTLNFPHEPVAMVTNLFSSTGGLGLLADCIYDIQNMLS